ncbi:gliding motility-associated C-terminal domain-containing protein [Persicitalea jodogahamensis]
MEATATANRYTMTLVQFWDENTLTNGNTDQSAELLFYRKRDNRLVFKSNLPFVSRRNVSYQNQACAAYRSLKTIEGTYKSTVTLPPSDFDDPQGYYIVWERCCRNDDINNIDAPGSNGMVFYLEFPPLTTQNSSPVFSFPNGDYICKDQTFSMNMSARDADDDELRYSLVTPMRGNTGRTNPIGNDSPKSGYALVNWSAGISDQNMIPGSPSLKINERNGNLTVVADQLGLYVFTIQVEEYRNGVKIGLVRRDFQLLVIECSKNTPPEPFVYHEKVKANILEFCEERPIVLDTETAPNWSYQWQLNGQNIPGETSPSITARDTGSYAVVKSFKDQCSRDTASQLVKLVQGTPPPAIISRATDTICAGKELSLLANEGNTYSYEWTKGFEKLSENGKTLKVSEQAWYHLLVRDEKNGCTARDSARVSVEEISVSLPARASLLRGSSLPLRPKVESTNGPVSYSWFPPEGLSSTTDSVPTVTPDDNRAYVLQVTSPIGCIASDTINLFVIDRLFIPDAFSPNGDGINDLFVIRNGDDQIEDIRIFNRWGSVVYQNQHYESPWDGRYRESFVPAGSYIYQIKTPFLMYEGVITVIY